MTYESRAYDKVNDDGFPPDPVVVLVVTGTHDNRGRAALRLLAEHGGPDLLTVPDGES